MNSKPVGATITIRAENIGFSYSGGFSGNPRPLLENIHLEIKPGEIVGLTGPSGVGKSTLGDILLGISLPSSGQVFWNDQPVFNKKTDVKKRMRRYYQKIFQDPTSSFPPDQIIRQAFTDVVCYYHLSHDSAETDKLIQENFSSLGLTPDMLERYPCQLSGGEMQRIALARIMLLNPRFIMADEPTSRLDLSVQASIIHFIADLSHTHGCAVMLVSHDIKLIRAVCKKCWCLIPGSTHLTGATIKLV